MLTKTFESLPNECLREIFSFIEKDGQSLFSCLFVSRLWCKHVVPILWRNPFRHFHSLTSTYSYTLCRTLLSGLNENEQKIMFPYDISQYNFSKPIFKYTEHLEKLSFREIETAADSWIQHEQNNCTNEPCRIQLIMGAIVQLIMRTGRRLKELKLCSGYVCLDIKEGLKFNNSDLGFTNLNKLVIEIEHIKMIPNLIKLWKIFPNLCKNLHELVYIIYEEDILDNNITDSLSEILSSQKNLNRFSLELSESDIFRSEDSNENYKIQVGGIMSALYSRKESLNSLSLNFINFSATNLEGITELTKLETLEIYNCSGISKKNHNKFLRSSFFLKKLIWEDNDPLDREILLALLGKSGRTLINFGTDELSMETIQTITRLCPNIKEFTLVYHDQELDAFLNYFKGSKINQLNVESSNFIYEDDRPINVLTFLGEYIPPNLEILKLNSKFDSFSFEKLLSNYSISSSKSMQTIHIEVFLEEIIKYIEIIFDYVKLGNVLKKLVIPPIQWKDNELNFIDKIKEFGKQYTISFSEVWSDQ
ncbi:4094_t:CDS:2 [Diversispora eburnea]|uniref:4094_t:CDS:1 n=1 Tax=Diversispora eburnea TaxID=1213867 RepID=A0A9N9F388_9GLOM|nr:4094_t:CDS:2 [Diversispora eburnea]